MLRARAERTPPMLRGDYKACSGLSQPVSGIVAESVLDTAHVVRMGL
jgi:hypothetical protein